MYFDPRDRNAYSRPRDDDVLTYDGQSPDFACVPATVGTVRVVSRCCEVFGIWSCSWGRGGMAPDITVGAYIGLM
jgi:hypothetical protein